MAVSERRNGELTAKAIRLPPDEIIFGRSAAMAAIRQKVQKVLGTDVPILIQGANGTGKGLLAHYVHSRSVITSGAFIKVNCAAIPGALLESELFGYEKGAFTGAHTSKPGKVEFAHNGTLFLDAIADLDLSLQSKLLQFLQDGRFSRIGQEEERLVKTRLICAANKELEQEIDSGRFRADLYYRVNVVRLRLPPLRERREDIPLLAEYFRIQYQEKFMKRAEPLNAEMLRTLQNMDWSGNIRELSNHIARHVLIGPEAQITQEAAVRRRSAASGDHPAAVTIPLKQVAKDAIRDRERNYILEALQENQWNRRKAAQTLKISYRTLIYKMRNAGLISRRLRFGPALPVNPSSGLPTSADQRITP